MVTEGEYWIIATAWFGNLLLLITLVVIIITLVVIIYQAKWGRIAVLIESMKAQTETHGMLRRQIAEISKNGPLEDALLPIYSRLNQNK